MSNVVQHELNFSQRFLKRSFDILCASVGLICLSPLLLSGWVAATISTRNNGFFFQRRIGRFGKPFWLIKLRSMRTIKDFETTVTTDGDPRITPIGRFLRKAKLDELPQLLNVLLGQMSIVGPRPDVPGFADQLDGNDRIMLQLRPGITGPASLKFRREEDLLAKQDDPEQFNRTVIWPEKVRLNCEYARNYRFRRDIGYILETLFPSKT